MGRKRTLYLENPTRREVYDAIKDARAMGYHTVIAHGKKFKSEWGVKKKVFKLGKAEEPLLFKQL